MKYAVIFKYKTNGSLRVEVLDDGYEDIRDAEIARVLLLKTKVWSKENPQDLQVIQYS